MIKLFRRFTKLKRVIYFGLVVILIDFISMITYPRIFYNFFNMLSVMLYSTSLIYCLIRFSSQIQTVDIHLYKMIQRVNHLLYVTVAVLYMDLIYIVVAKVILDFDFLLNSISSSKNISS